MVTLSYSVQSVANMKCPTTSDSFFRLALRIKDHLRLEH